MPRIACVPLSMHCNMLYLALENITITDSILSPSGSTPFLELYIQQIEVTGPNNNTVVVPRSDELVSRIRPPHLLTRL